MKDKTVRLKKSLPDDFAPDSGSANKRRDLLDTGDIRQMAADLDLILQRLKGLPARNNGVGAQGDDAREILDDMRDVVSRSERSLREALRFHRALFNAFPGHIALLDSAGRITSVNSSWHKLTNNESLVIGDVGENYSQLCERYALASGRQAAVGVRSVLNGVRNNYSLEYQGARKDSERWYRLFVSRIQDEGADQVLVMHTDITDLKKIEIQFLRVQRLESIGTLAGGIAHDLNNVLGPILLAAGLLKSYVKEEDGQEILSAIEHSAKRGGELVRQVLSFSRGMEGNHAVISPEQLLVDCSKIIKETFPRNITIELKISSEISSVMGDLTQINQVLMNLCVNARDAMPAGGKLGIFAENTTVDEQFAGLNVDAHPGRFVRFVVRDTGAGIPLEIRHKIFDPFFTTKEVGKGTGLGLSTVMGIVRGHGGFVTFQTQLGRGSEFHVYLPACENNPIEDELDQAAPLSYPRGNGELILLVDDETPTLTITRSTLEAYGYNVITAKDGVDALAVYMQNQDNVRLVLTDMIMPVMDGSALIHTLKKLRPGMPIVAATGMASQEQMNRATSAGVRHILAKPYSADSLLNKLYLALQEKPELV